VKGEEKKKRAESRYGQRRKGMPGAGGSTKKGGTVLVWCRAKAGGEELKCQRRGEERVKRPALEKKAPGRKDHGSPSSEKDLRKKKGENSLK